MKYSYVILTVLILATAVVATHNSKIKYGQAMDFGNKIQSAAVTNLQEMPKLGAVGLDIFAFGARDVGGSTNPNTPLEYRVQISQAAAHSPPITNAYNPTILLIVIYNDGSFELYGTEDVPNVLASNRFTYDPSLKRWVNGKGMAQGNVKGVQNFVGLVSLNGDTKMIQKTINVR